MKVVNRLLFLVILFTIIIFFIRNIFFLEAFNEYEESHIEKTIFFKEEEDLIGWEVYKKEAEESNVLFYYVPKRFEKDTLDYREVLDNLFSVDYIQEKIDDLNVVFYLDLVDVRWRMKDKTLKLFWVKQMKKEEFTSVSIHEFAHYIDIYFLERKVLKDTSYYFYDISWKSTKVLKSWQKQSDFVSWYSMTNKYEDFAESLTYYILHNSDFLFKAEKSEILKKKYDFFSKYVFRKKEFIETDFSWWLDLKIQEYYRDITKIEYNLDIFLQFLKKKI